MGDLISRAKAIAMHKDECSGECGCCKYYIARDLECGILLNVPAVEAEPVRHAKWEEYPDRAHIRCTGCRVEFKKEKMPMSRTYCPNCGAKMGGDADG